MGQPKQFLALAGQTILARTIAVFEQANSIDEIILVVNQDDIDRARQIRSKKLKQIVAGGKERQDSVFNGLQALPADTDIVAIHDGARPLVTVEIIERAIAEAEKFGAIVVGVPVVDTIKKVVSSKQLVESSERRVEETLDRSLLWAAQTPQIFKKEIIVKAYSQKDQHKVTDDAMLVEKLGIPVKMVMGSYHNIKITSPADLMIAEAILKEGK